MDYALPTPWFSPRPFTSPWRDEARGDDRRRGRRRPDPMLMEADGPGPDERRGPRGGRTGRSGKDSPTDGARKPPFDYQLIWSDQTGLSLSSWI